MKKFLLIMCGLSLCGCVRQVKRPMYVVDGDYAKKSDLIDVQEEIIVQMEALIEEVKEINEKGYRKVAKVIDGCICPTDMK